MPEGHCFFQAIPTSCDEPPDGPVTQEPVPSDRNWDQIVGFLLRLPMSVSVVYQLTSRMRRRYTHPQCEGVKVGSDEQHGIVSQIPEHPVDRIFD